MGYYTVLTTHSLVLTKFIQMVVSSSISDSASVFGKDWWWEAFESGYILKQLCWSQLISPGVYSRTVGGTMVLELLSAPGTQCSTQVHMSKHTHITG